MKPESEQAPQDANNNIENAGEMSPEDFAEMLGQISALKEMLRERQDELDLLGYNTTEIKLKTRLETEIEELKAEIEAREELAAEE